MIEITPRSGHPSIEFNNPQKTTRQNTLYESRTDEFIILNLRKFLHRPQTNTPNQSEIRFYYTKIKPKSRKDRIPESTPRSSPKLFRPPKLPNQKPKPRSKFTIQETNKKREKQLTKQSSSMV